MVLFLALNNLGYASSIVYSNLGSGEVFSSSNGWTIGYPFSANEVGQSEAFSFSVSGDFILTSIDLAISDISIAGQSEFVVGIYQDSLGKPDLPLTSVSGMAPENLYPNFIPSSLTTIQFIDSVFLNDGFTYWVGIHPASPQPTDLVWLWNYLDSNIQSVAWQSNTLSEVLTGGQWEQSFMLTEPAFRINGTVVPAQVPEPSYMFFFGIISIAACLGNHKNHIVIEKTTTI